MKKKKYILFLIILTICIPEIIFRLPVPEHILSSSELTNIIFYIARITFTGLAVFFGYSFIKDK